MIEDATLRMRCQNKVWDYFAARIHEDVSTRRQALYRFRRWKERWKEREPAAVRNFEYDFELTAGRSQDGVLQ